MWNRIHITFLVACTRLYKPLSVSPSISVGRSDRPSVGPSHCTSFRRVAYSVACTQLMSIGLFLLFTSWCLKLCGFLTGQARNMPISPSFRTWKVDDDTSKIFENRPTERGETTRNMRVTWNVIGANCATTTSYQLVSIKNDQTKTLSFKNLKPTIFHCPYVYLTRRYGLIRGHWGPALSLHGRCVCNYRGSQFSLFRIRTFSC